MKPQRQLWLPVAGAVAPIVVFAAVAALPLAELEGRATSTWLSAARISR